MPVQQIADDNISEILSASLCLSFAFLAGLFQGGFGCALAWVAKRKAASEAVEQREPAWLSKLNLVAVVGSATLPGVLSIAALAFGAISMVVVVRSSSILVFNVLFTRLLGLGTIKKNDGVGTALCLIGIVALFKVAPTDSSVTDADYLYLLSRPESLSWNAILVLSCLACMAAVYVLERHRRRRQAEASRHPERKPAKRTQAAQHRAVVVRAALVSVVVAASSAAMDLSAKGYTGSIANREDGAFWSSGIFWLSLFVFVVSAVVMRGYYVYGCKACDVLVFIPLNTMLIIFVSAATGFFVMEEWRSVKEWDEFCASYLVIFLGINLLVSKEARDRISGPGSEQAATATLLEVQQLCTDMYTATDKAVAVATFEQLVHKAVQLGEVESTELVALVVALLNELPELPMSLIGDWVQLAYPTIFNYVQDTSTTPGPQRHTRSTTRKAVSAVSRMNRFLPTQPSRSHTFRYRAMLDPAEAAVGGRRSPGGVALVGFSSEGGGVSHGVSHEFHDNGHDDWATLPLSGTAERPHIGRRSLSSGAVNRLVILGSEVAAVGRRGLKRARNKGGIFAGCVARNGNGVAPVRQASDGDSMAPARDMDLEDPNGTATAGGRGSVGHPSPCSLSSCTAPSPGPCELSTSWEELEVARLRDGRRMGES